MRSQVVWPAGTRSGCAASVRLTGSVTCPAAVETRTWVTAGPITESLSKATRIVPGLAGESKLTWIHWPCGPVQLPDSHMVRGLLSTAANGSRPLAHSPGLAVMSEADDEAVTSATPMYFATAWYLFQSRSV